MLEELVIEQMEFGWVVEVMAVGQNQEPSVLFHQLFGDFILNFKLLTQGTGEVEPLDFNELSFQSLKKVVRLQVVEKMLEIISEKVEQGHCDAVMETAWTTLWNVTDVSRPNCERFLAAGGMFLFLKCKVSQQGR